jgi:transposase
MKTRARLRGTQDAQYAKRQLGIELLLSKKYRQAEIAAILKVAHGTVRGWSSKLKAKDKTVKQQSARGRKQGTGRSLTKAQEAKIIGIIRDKTPKQIKMEFYLWSVGAVMSLIEKLFQIELSESGVRKYLNAWGFTIQRPATRYSSRDDVLVQKWLQEVYPKIAARAKKEKAEIHWLDEAGINNQAIYQRGFAPSGKTPVAVKPSKKEKTSMISTVTNQGTMRFRVYEGGLKVPLFIEFLEQLVKEAAQKPFVIMDNLPVHKGKAVQAWLAENTDKIEVFYLPPYAPDLNPDEYLNNDLKQNVHRYSGLPQSKKALKSNVISYLRHIQKSPAKVRSYFQANETKYAA